MKITATQLRRIIKEEVSKALNEAALVPGAAATYSHPSFPRLGTITGKIAMEDGELMFMPDAKFHDKVYAVTGQEPLEGLYVDGANVEAV